MYFNVAKKCTGEFANQFNRCANLNVEVVLTLLRPKDSLLKNRSARSDCGGKMLNTFVEIVELSGPSVLQDCVRLRICRISKSSPILA